MNTNEINQCLKNQKSFVGTFPANMIKPQFRLPASFVINTSPWMENRNSSQGTHWVALYITKKSKGVYFDSFGLPPMQRDIRLFIEHHCTGGFKYNTQTLQHPLSSVCGVYCIDFVMNIESPGSLRIYLSRYKTNLQLNDKLVVDAVTCRLSTSQQHLASKIRALLN